MTKTTSKPEPIFLYHGGHSAESKQMCFNEAIAWLAGEPHSASPACASPVIRRFGMALNDRLDDERRQLLRPYVLRSLGTAGDGRDPERREMCVQWLVEHLPDLFDRAGLGDAATQLRGALKGGLAEENVLRILRAARDEAWSIRNARLSELRTRVREEVRKRLAETGASDDEAVAAAAAAEAAVAEAAAAAAAEAAAAAAVEAAVAEAAVEAAAVEAAAVEAAVAAAAVAAAAVEAAVAAAVAEAAVAEVEAAAAAEVGSSRYWEIRDAVYSKVYPVAKAKALEILGPSIDELLPSALDLFDRMLPPEPLQAPVIDNAELLFAAPEQAA